MSVQSLVLIAVDRFGAVVFPFRSPLISSKLCPYFILATWIVSMAFHSPYLFFTKLVEYEGQLFCGYRWNEFFGSSSYVSNYFLARYIVFFYIPLVFLGVLYSIIFIKLKSAQKIPGEQSANAEQQRERRSRNVLKMAIAIVMGSALCWVPFTIVWLSHFFHSGIKFFSFFEVAMFMLISNCTINPCICFIFSSNYKRALSKLLRCLSNRVTNQE